MVDSFLIFVVSVVYILLYVGAFFFPFYLIILLYRIWKERKSGHKRFVQIRGRFTSTPDTFKSELPTEEKKDKR